MQTHFRDPENPPVTAAASPYFTTGQLIHELGLTPDPRAV